MDSIWIATPVGFIPLLFPLTGVLSIPLEKIFPFDILKTPDLIPKPESSPEIFAPLIL